jgi:hypothetical protein
MVEVHYGESVTNHADPEACTAYREVGVRGAKGRKAGLSGVFFAQ